MERKEFEQILKRALELQSLQKKQSAVSDNTYTTEDLQSAATRLGIADDILEKAISETGHKFKKFHLTASPDDVREAFLKHFLMQESNASPQHQPMRIDHNTIKIGSNSAIRVFHPHASSIEAFVEFSDDGSGGTNVSWSGNSDLGTTTKILVGGWPFAIFAFIAISALFQGLAFLPLLPMFFVFLFTSQIMLWGMRKNAQRLEENLVSYFQNCQTLDEIEAHKVMKKELEDLRRKDQQQISGKQKEILQQPINELSENEPETCKNPDNPQISE
ncbi:MAG: hypothetical protein ACOYXC_18650 [Candidatus Rifleibacteriota bacterium]